MTRAAWRPKGGACLHAVRVSVIVGWAFLPIGMAWAGAVDNGLLLSLTVPPRAGDRFQQAEFSFWLADPARPVKAVIVHQHGCTNASPDKHPPVTLDFHWRALARKHDCALLVPMFQVAGNCSDWNDPDSGSERALLDALDDLGSQARRPELTTVPWVLWGHSGGSSWSAQMIVRHPNRVLAASFRGGCHKQFGVPEFRESFAAAAQDLPLLFVWGKREAVPASSHYVSWQPMNAMYRRLRGAGGTVARLIDPASEHGCDDSRLVVIPFFDAVLSARLASQRLPGALVDIDTREDRAIGPEPLRDPGLAWLPTPDLARLWREFSETGTIRPSKPRLKAPVLEASRLADGRLRLNWRVEPELTGGLRALRLYRDGKLWRELGVKPDAKIATGRDAPPEGLRESGLTEDSVSGDERPVFALTLVDAAGHESPPGTAP